MFKTKLLVSPHPQQNIAPSAFSTLTKRGSILAVATEPGLTPPTATPTFFHTEQPGCQLIHMVNPFRLGEMRALGFVTSFPALILDINALQMLVT